MVPNYTQNPLTETIVPDRITPDDENGQSFSVKCSFCGNYNIVTIVSKYIQMHTRWAEQNLK